MTCGVLLAALQQKTGGYRSPARVMKESIAKAQRLAERIKNQNALRYINSDSDDDDVQIHVELPTPSHFVPISTPRIELPVEKKKKKKKSKTSKNRNHKNKKKKKQQRRRSSSSSSDSSEDNLRRTRERSCSDASSSSSDSEDNRNRKRKTPKVIIRRERWGFLGYREERSIEGSFIVFDHQYDHENFNMDAIPKGHTLDYRPRYFSIINGNGRLDELFFSKELREVKGKSKRSERYFDGVLRKLDDSLVERKFRRLPSLSEAGMDYMALSKTRLQEFEFLHQIAERKAAEKEREALEIEVAFSTPSHAIHLETRRRLLATEFANDKRNPHVLDQFLKINEEIFEASRISGTPLDRRALADRQLSIIDQAIASNQRAVEFRLKRLEYLKELRPRDDLLREWEQILNVFVNKCAVWAKYLDFIQYDSALYGKDVLERAFDRCFAKLTGLLGGTMKSHKLEANTENFLLDTYVRRLLWWMESGYSNRAIASVQATIEYNFLVPDSLNGSPEEKKREAFEKFWNSGVPRFGDEGARGWREFHKTLENLEEAQNREKIARALQEQKSNELEERVASSEDSLITSWVEMERELENIESRPRRPLPDTCANMSADHAMKVVTFKDIRIFKGAGVHVLLSLLHTLGAHFVDSLIYSVIDLSMQLPRLPTFRLLEEWDLLPSLRKLFPVPSPGAQDVVLDMIHAVVELQPEIVYVASLLETYVYQRYDR
ncbi:hypothetical protein Y032_0311g2138 [Ancylostoma ceylanicum]|uniref:Uncharacterized protein n=1 Tax=Ancylostoma ceylanicum TaxID=53326 RepID=A0A016S381_9BILA|nr:hypothetical protein Y032_0311g2138 [Ancylostoma ceylanicum]